MGKYDGIISDNKESENQVKFSLTDFHFLNNVLYINKNLKFILHSSQYSNKFTIQVKYWILIKIKLKLIP